jgi:uncharacterized protein (DUF924 family)
MRDDVLRFWFEEADRAEWYGKNDAFDELIRRRFGEAYEKAATGEYDDWRASGTGCVALCILLDQFPRNLFRGSAKAFATDHLALAIARRAVKRGLDRDARLTDDQLCFLYMPFQHSENIEDQRLCVRLANERIINHGFRRYAEQHFRIIERFGRFPHRNAILGRPSTREELDFLTEPGSSF